MPRSHVPAITRPRATARLLDQALASAEDLEQHSGDAALATDARRAAERLRWVGRWLLPGWSARPALVLPASEVAARADALLEALEDADPLANADAVQVCSLTFAITSALAARAARSTARPPA